LSAQWAGHVCPAFLLGKRMSEKIAKLSIGSSQMTRRVIAERINAAFETGDIAEICHAIEAATRQHNVVRASKGQASIARSQGEKSARISERF